jgi:hypothetical protein
LRKFSLESHNNSIEGAVRGDLVEFIKDVFAVRIDDVLIERLKQSPSSPRKALRKEAEVVRKDNRD